MLTAHYCYLCPHFIASSYLIFQIFFSDEDQIREENKGFINDDDDDVEDASGSDSDSGRKKRRREEEEDDDLEGDNLDDDDFDLIEENYGVKIDRKVSCCFFIIAR